MLLNKRSAARPSAAVTALAVALACPGCTSATASRHAAEDEDVDSLAFRTN